MSSAMSKEEFKIEWIGQLKHACIQESLHTGIYPSVTAAIAFLESAYGTSALTREHYNFFGMTINPRDIGYKITFWDGMSYIGQSCRYRHSMVFADYTQAGDYGSGFLLSLRHFGWNFWAAPRYGRMGVLNHVSSGLTAAEARSDAIQQLIELQIIYDPHPKLEEDLSYIRAVIDLIEQYDLWRFDEEFLALGGWDGTVPYHFS